MSDGRIVITGAGLITPLGATREETWQAVLAGRCGIGKLTALESPAPEGKGGGQAVELPTDYEPAMPREARYLRRAIADAVRDAGLADGLTYAPARCGIVLGTTLHGMREGGRFLRSGDYAHLADFSANAVLAHAAAGLPVAGIAATTCSACSSSLGAVALAVTLLKSGELDLVIAGGYDPISDYAYGGFNSLRLVAQGPLRPFAKDREGMKVSEGYGIVVLERAEGSARRSKRALATVLGYGESADAHHLTQPHPEGDGAARAIDAALTAAGLKPDDIDLIAAHATGTPDNDAGEYAAFKRTFGGQLPKVPVVAFKSHLGHTLGGAGAVELILSAMAMREQVIPACANVRAEEVEFDGLNLSTSQARPGRIRATLNTSLGFGGANTCVILGPGTTTAGSAGAAGETRTAPVVRGRPKREVLITGIGVVLPGVVGAEAFARRMAEGGRPAWERDAGAVAEAEYLHLLNARRVRRMSDYVKLTLAATTLAVQDAAVADWGAFAESCSVILGSLHGSANYCHQYYGEIVKQGLIGANPMLFAEGVPNAAAAHLSLMLGLKGACQTVIGSRTAGLDALRLAGLRIATGQWDRALVGAGEEYYSVINAAWRHCGLYAADGAGAAPFASEKGFVTGAAAVTFVLESAESVERRGGRVRGRLVGAMSARGSKAELAQRTRDVLIGLGRPGAVISSANGTWLDRVELSGIEHARSAEGTSVSALYGHVPECFSAGPLLAAASVLSNGKLPRLMGQGIECVAGLRGAEGTEEPESVAVIAGDYTGLVSGVRVARQRG